jgi:predicted NBD/HSP70 family sugar kinase
MRQVNLNQFSAASSETARHINRRIVLNVIRHRQPISRADVARCSGLQRSTVSLITEELVEDRWVVEGPGKLPRGRRPKFLTLNDQRLVICIDIRPTQITVGVGDVNGAFTPHEIIPTPAEPDVAVKKIVQWVRLLRKARPHATFEGIGVSVPGRIDLASYQLVFAPNLKWPITDLRGPLERETGLEVQLENAANACALAEIWFGFSKKVQDLVAITVSEGIGAGIIAHGELITGRRGMAGEFGHVPLLPDGPLCSCGNRGCWEVLASNRAALRYYFEARSAPEESAGHDFGFQDLLALAERGDVLAHRALTRMAAELGRGTRMIVAGLSPEVITFIGEFTAAWSRYRPVIEAEVQAQSITPGSILLLAGQDGATARVRGTIALVFQKHFGATAPPIQKF